MRPARAGEPSLLIVDDEASARLTLSMLLKRAGYRVEEAVRRLDEEPYDVVVTDLRMEGNGGMEILRAAKSVSPSPEGIVLTAYGSISSAVEAMKLGAFDYLTKPFEPDEGSSPQIPPATCRRLVYPGRGAWGHLPHGDPGRSV